VAEDADPVDAGEPCETEAWVGVRVPWRDEVAVAEEADADPVDAGEPCEVGAWVVALVSNGGELVSDDESLDASGLDGPEHAARMDEIAHATAPAHLMEDFGTSPPFWHRSNALRSPSSCIPEPLSSGRLVLPVFIGGTMTRTARGGAVWMR
jgi:hypothetical protein